MKIGVLVSGGGTNLQAIIDACEKKEIPGQVVAVISNKKNAYALERAKNHKIFQSVENDEEEIIALLKEKKVDVVVLAGYLKILSAEMVEAFQNKIINIHPSLIPSFSGAGYYGIKVHESVIARGCKISGATVHFVNEGADEGPIISQEVVRIEDDDTPTTLQQKVLKVEHKILVEVLKNMANKRLKIESGRVFLEKSSNKCD